MSDPVLEQLYAQYDEIIDQMNDEFDSHQFILELAHRYQREYIEALYQFRNDISNAGPFGQLHSKLATRLRTDHSDRLRRLEDHESKNIFGRDSKCAQWRKIT